MAWSTASELLARYEPHSGHEAIRSRMRTQIELDNTAAAELAGVGDKTLRSLRGQLGVELILRGNLLTIDGDDEAVLAAEAVVRELSELVEHGHDLIPATVDAVSDAL